MHMTPPGPEDLDWHSTDVLARLGRGEPMVRLRADPGGLAGASIANQTPKGRPSHDLESGAPSLLAVEGDPGRVEALSVLRSGKPSTRHVMGFAARNRSTWALDVLASRWTGGRHDWETVRAAAIRFAARPRERDPILDEIKLSNLWIFSEALHARGMDRDAEEGLLKFIATRVSRGAQFEAAMLEPLIEDLLSMGLDGLARELLPSLKEDTWVRHAIATDLEHPRFGGTFEALLAVLNGPYRQYGLEPIILDEPGERPFERVGARARSTELAGPLVTIVMTCFRPGPEIYTAVRSVIGQTYVHWELIITDDSSPSEYDEVLESLAGLDSRIRVIRNEQNAGTYVRRNEAILSARGEFLTAQDSDDWSHPRRLEIQVRDLLATPDRLANTVRAARVTEDFSFVSPRGARLFTSEPSILFRVAPVVDAIGYFDTTRKGADTEFRQRLEIATGQRVPVVGPEIPLELMLADTSSLSGGDFGKTLWTAPARVAYRSSYKRFHEAVRSGTASPKLPFPQDVRRIMAPPLLRGEGLGDPRFDLLVVVDGHGTRARSPFIDQVTSEIQTALARGLRIALMHSESVSGVQNAGPLAGPLQALVDAGAVTRVFAEDEIVASTVVVRNAGAAQGHPAGRRPVVAEAVIVVEDASADDLRGVTIARDEVVRTVESWFGETPRWAIAQMPPPPIHLVSIVESGDGERLRVTLTTEEPSQIEAVRIVGGRTLESLPRVGQDGLVRADFLVEEIPPGDLVLAGARTSPLGGLAQQSVRIDSSQVFASWSRDLVMATSTGGLRVVRSGNADESSGGEDFISQFLSATIVGAGLFRDNVELDIAQRAETSLRSVYGVRDVDGLVRRRNFSIRANDGAAWRVSHKVADLDATRWRTFGTFATPLGPLQAPIPFEEGLRAVNSSEFRLRLLEDDGFSVIHVVPQMRSRGRRDPLLSVVMPVYNVAPYLDTAIRSVLSQDLRDLELIVIDDASTDNSRSIIEMHRTLDHRVRAIYLDHNTLGGAGIPSNLGIRAARGKYVAFVDSDDFVADGAFASLVRLAEQNEADLVVGDFRTFDEADRVLGDAYDSEAWRDIPLETVISAYTHPALLRLSAVPWRKLYRRIFLTQHAIEYPEGDYFWEDNPLHWFVLARADRIVATSKVVSFHRMGREGQTMSADQYKLGAMFSHANSILSLLTDTEHPSRGALFQEFFAYLERLKWAVKRQTQGAAAQLLKRNLADVFDRALEVSPGVALADSVREQFDEYRAAYPDIDLTVIMPVFNGADLLRESLDSVLRLDGIAYNVLVVDDGSTDGSLKIAKEYEKKHPNVHVFAQKNRGAGRARNSVIPLANGRYTYFLDADDTIDAEALKLAVGRADADGLDLVFFKYQISFPDEGRSQPMFKGDLAIWSELEVATTHEERQRLVVGLINYPWNRIIRTSLLHDANIFFGSTVVHNDLLYHWHSCLAATKIGTIDVVVCTHRKFRSRAQVTNIGDERRLQVLEALRSVFERISHLEQYERVSNAWLEFALHLLEWAKDRVPEEMRVTYEMRASELVGTFEAGFEIAHHNESV